MKGLGIGAALAVVIAGCRPSSVAEAEAKGDVAWLEGDGSPAAVLALGRMADGDAKAARALTERARFDEGAYVAAWGGVRRGAPWGSELLHAGLRDPARADAAARAVVAEEPKSSPFVADAEAALTRLAAGGQTSGLAGLLARAGAPAHDAVLRRLADKTTRGAMCAALGGSSASADGRAALREAPAASRDDAACVTAAVSIAALDDATLKWLATSAEPGMLGAASRLGAIPCPRLHGAWVDALAARPEAEAAALTVPLGEALRRCPATIDGVVAEALGARPAEQLALVGAIDPFDPEVAGLKATCAALPAVVAGRGAALAKERASDALEHGCRGRR